jgi:hypothetical protein
MATSEFGKAFRSARTAGDKTFMFNGKKYTTDMAPEEQKSVGGKPKAGEYKPRDSDTRKGEIMTSKNAKGRDEYTRSGQKSFDTETEFVPPDMSKYKPRRAPEALTSTTRPGTNTNYENDDTSDMTYKRGGKIKKMASGGSASSRGDGIATKGKTRGKMC